MPSAAGALYYPSINLPSTPWFTQVLLYWEAVGTIVPGQILNRRGELSTFTSELLEHGLVTAVEPDHALEGTGVGDLVRPFLALVDSSIVPGQHRAGRPAHRVHIHVDKPGLQVAEELIERGLASWSRRGREYEWLEVEEQTGNLFMAFLASILGRREGRLMDPVTDSMKCLSLFARLRPLDSKAARRLDHLRVQVLEAILPMPLGPPSPALIARFKREHRQQLASFRGAVEQTILTVAAIPEDDLRERQLEVSLRALQADRDDIAARMGRHGWERIQFASLAAVVGAATLAFDALSSGGPMAVTGNAIGLFSAVAAAFASARTPQTVVESPMAYAALARQLTVGGVSLRTR